MQRILVETVKGGTYTASSKARDDAAGILASMGFVKKPVYVSESTEFISLLRNIPSSYKQLRKTLIGLEPGTVLAFQYPWDSLTYGFASMVKRFAGEQRLKTIALIHDINSLRTPSFLGKFYYQHVVKEPAFLDCFDRVICHNNVMREYLVNNGLSEDKIIILDAFDYLMGREQAPTASFSANVIIAGNLSVDKAPYIAELSSLGNINYRFDLFGIGYEGLRQTSNIAYHGAYPPDELCDYLRSGFGLVWDGDSIDGCSGSFGNYQRYNNPHKMSLYLACGLPIIVWDQAAIASFVMEQGVGFTVRSLRELDGRIASMTKEEYTFYAQCAQKIGTRMRTGCYLKKAMRKALEG